LLFVLRFFLGTDADEAKRLARGLGSIPKCRQLRLMTAIYMITQRAQS
jgi:hypothetical protein